MGYGLLFSVAYFLLAWLLLQSKAGPTGQCWEKQYLGSYSGTLSGIAGTPSEESLGSQRLTKDGVRFLPYIQSVHIYIHLYMCLHGCIDLYIYIFIYLIQK